MTASTPLIPVNKARSEATVSSNCGMQGRVPRAIVAVQAITTIHGEL